MRTQESYKTSSKKDDDDDDSDETETVNELPS